MVPRVLKYLRRVPAAQQGTANVAFAGNYAAWDDAVSVSTGYGNPVILERTCASLLRVKRGEPVFERDSVLFDTPQHSFPVLMALLRATVVEKGRLSVADFGGSLGSSYFQCRPLLRGVPTVEWNVIEQEPYVRCGREHFEDGELSFSATLDECVAHRNPNTLLMSGVLQYLPDPYAALEQLLEVRIRHVIVDRTAFLASDRDRLTVQTVPEWIYPASYPAWFLSERKFAAMFAAAGYRLVADFAGADTVSLPDETSYFKGFIYERAEP
jgi:putative methyltransferase (TIGR04325 family)